ncbi:MAG: serine hydrolase domain-containing protein, partial [Gemmatimonadales bacterium]
MRHRSVLITAALLLPVTLQAQTATRAAPPSLESIDSLAQAAIETGRVPGLSIAIMQDGRITFARGYGTTSVDKGGVPVTAETRFAIGSVTKQFTSAAIFLLAEEGKLSVHDPVAKWYPSLTGATNITLLDLMNHVSGYTDYYPLDFVDRRMQKAASAESIIQRYATAALDFEPGTRWSYSNTGFIILGRVVERVSGQSFGAFLSRRIFQPLGLRHTSFEPKQTSGAGWATGHTSFALGPIVTTKPEGRGWAGAAGAIWSTPSDLATWDLALSEGRVLKPESYALMTRPRLLADGTSTHYACGLDVATIYGWTVLSHGGAVSGFISNNRFVPDARSALVVLTNGESGQGLQPINGFGTRIITAGTAPARDTTAVAAVAAPAATKIPTINGPSPVDVATALFAALQQGAVDRATLSEEYSHFLDPEKLRVAATALAPLGVPDTVTLQWRGERGGLEVAVTNFKFGNRRLQGLMYRSTDGKVEEFL